MERGRKRIKASVRKPHKDNAGDGKRKGIRRKMRRKSMTGRVWKEW